MSTDGTLFEVEVAIARESSASAVAPISDDQVVALRGALDAAGLREMAVRRGLIERLLGRSVNSLRDLSASDARILATKLNSLYPSERPQTVRASAWDDRDDETWIDRL